MELLKRCDRSVSAHVVEEEGRTEPETIETGKLADLVLLDANPLDEIRNVARVRGVWRGGRYLDRAAIDAMLERLAATPR